MRMTNLLIPLFLILLMRYDLASQSKERVCIGNVINLNSKELNEVRTIYVYLPESYFESTFEYPVLYLLDAESDFHHTTGTIDFLSGTGKIPEVIVVGIVNTNRSRDLTPEAPNDEENKEFWGEIGGAINFKSFIREELIPYVNSNFRTVDYRLLRGQSFGGLFGFFDLFDTENLFNAYILTSPPIRWNENMFFNKIQNVNFEKYGRTKLYIGEPEFDWDDDSGIKEFSDIWKESQINKDFFEYELFKGEGHYSLVYNATQNGLKFIYRNWAIPDLVKNSSDLESLKTHYARLSYEFGYQIKIPMDQLIRIANDQLRRKDYDSGIEIAKRNVELYPEQPQTYWHVGDAYYLAGKYREALDYFKQALEKAKILGINDLSDYEISIKMAGAKID